MYCRPSLKPLAHICPSCCLEEEYRIDSPTEARDLGSANHELCAMMVRDGTVDVEAVRLAAERHSVDPLALAELFGGAEEAWASLSYYFPSPLVEFPLELGTADVLQIDLDDEIGAVVLDWKKRYSDGVRYQVLDYAHGVREHMHGLGIPLGDRVIKGVAVFCETGKAEVWDFREGDFAERARAEAEIMRNAGKLYNPGTHCSLCPRMVQCRALEETTARASHIVTGKADMLAVRDEKALSTEQVQELWGQAKHLEKALKDFKSYVRLQVETGGPMPLGDGKELYMQTQRSRDLRPVEAWAVLKQQGFTNEDLAKVTQLKLSEAIRIVRSRADGRRGAKKEAEAALRSLLEPVSDERVVQKLATRKVRDE